MFERTFHAWLRWLGGEPCFRIYGKARSEPDWRVIDVFATDRRNRDARLPLWRGNCVTWSGRVIAVGWDFAAEVVGEQVENPASREHPLEVGGGRLGDITRRIERGASGYVLASEVLAHECGHTWQAIRMRSPLVYLPLVGSVTLFREGDRFWNRFENEASEVGQFGGIVKGSVCDRLWPPMHSGGGQDETGV
jgi:hypothetical protein